MKKKVREGCSASPWSAALETELTTKSFKREAGCLSVRFPAIPERKFIKDGPNRRKTLGRLLRLISYFRRGIIQENGSYPSIRNDRHPFETDRKQRRLMPSSLPW
ncbi:hypothetical protein AVEN_265478-1 [Araneus ventricosus]|uniref:Uncharacterized protein n=1 Tax=Araneus ventricosus TaxID=182803 RepID=A0A4Y2CGK2_ARAVE|nr:hypothetical protein AVEN_265478-1 [Araneus ventricosus]